MTYNVLIVDDEEIVCKGLTQFVKWGEQGFAVVGTAYNVEDALVLLNQLSIDVVFMDIQMPERTGLELLQYIQENYPTVKSIILSGHSEFTYARDAMRWGAIDYLSKPVNLSEIEGLLKQLRQEFIQENRETQIQEAHLNALLLSIAKGHILADHEKYYLPALGDLYGISLEILNRNNSELIIHHEKEVLMKEIQTLILGTYILNHNPYGLFCIIPHRTDEETNQFLNFLEQACKNSSLWTCGVSKHKKGIHELQDAYRESERALQYQKAGGKNGIVLYQNIENLFSQSTPELQEGIKMLVETLAVSGTRAQVPELLIGQLNSHKNLPIMQFQTLCIQYLIELNGYMQEVKLKTFDLHGRLNATLESLLLCNDIQKSCKCILVYIDEIIHELNRDDEQRLGKGIIKDIQLFIIENFNKNLTLNILAEQFFLHPNYLSRLFKEKTGKTFIEYLTEIRMEKVKTLLEKSDNNVSEIGLMIGYDNPRYFSKVFKQYTGVTPTEYRDSFK